ncbi:hypothetical protein O6P43_028141 [Quillaja saponaria]|uniref:Uncharacterized protein n=1 Tax=Quillaja saponaria TaxID=32244 RepID=A0AAD7KXE0_QUISA|nr:hypothetical protein O6P43_028141 [Quillaja saponaria]
MDFDRQLCDPKENERESNREKGKKRKVQPGFLICHFKLQYIMQILYCGLDWLLQCCTCITDRTDPDETGQQKGVYTFHTSTLVSSLSHYDVGSSN